jgi:hypothetical protein
MKQNETKKEKKGVNNSYNNLCYYNEYNNYNNILNTQSIYLNETKMKQNETKKEKGGVNISYCNICDYSAVNKFNYHRHLQSIKHLNNLDKTKMKHVNKLICECGVECNSRTTLWRHKKKCNHKEESLNESINKQDKLVLFDKEELIIELLNQNKELMELLKNGTNQIINSNNINSNNKSFNLQVFLNETCKNAMNLSEFIENMTVELPDLENMGKLGYVEGVSNIIIKNLKALEITQRPLHCTDEKRETIMIKENNVWFKEGDDRENLRRMISTIVSRNLILLTEYEEKYPEFNKYDSHKSDEYNKIIMETIGVHSGEIEKKKEKVFRRIAREVVIDKSII